MLARVALHRQIVRLARMLQRDHRRAATFAVDRQHRNADAARAASQLQHLAHAAVHRGIQGGHELPGVGVAAAAQQAGFDAQRMVVGQRQPSESIRVQHARALRQQQHTVAHMVQRLRQPVGERGMLVAAWRMGGGGVERRQRDVHRHHGSGPRNDPALYLRLGCFGP